MPFRPGNRLYFEIMLSKRNPEMPDKSRIEAHWQRVSSLVDGVIPEVGPDLDKVSSYILFPSLFWPEVGEGL